MLLARTLERDIVLTLHKVSMWSASFITKVLSLVQNIFFPYSKSYYVNMKNKMLFQQKYAVAVIRCYTASPQWLIQTRYLY